MDGDILKVDLHIHTPASKCYKGPKSDEEYFEILKKVESLNIDLIAITDHNTIAGYEKLLELRKQVINIFSIIQEYQDTGSRINEAIKDCQDKLSLFNNITILPGVEITVNPGIHMIVLTSPEKYLDLSDLLNNIGYSNEKRGADSETAIDVDIKKFLSNQLLEDKIIIAPHIDSDKGIDKSLTGQFRAQIFRSPNIHAMTCNNSQQKERIQSLFKNEPLYKREIPVAFINASDAHKTDEIGSKLSYIVLKNKTIKDLKEVFCYKHENISDFNDTNLGKNISKLIKNEKTYTLEKIEKNGDLCHCICACLNNGFSYLILGVNSQGNLIGIKSENEDFNTLIKDEMRKLTSKCFQLRYLVNVEKMGNGNNIIIISFKYEVYNLWYISASKEVYIMKDNMPVAATIEDVEDLVEENTLLALDRFEDKNNKIVDNISTQLYSLKDTIDKYNLLYDISYLSSLLFKYIEITHREKDKIDISTKTYLDGNGKDNGNLHFVSNNGIRMQDAILRYSCPVNHLPADLISNYFIVDDTSIVISQNGGTHIANKNNYILGIDTNILFLKLNEESKTKFSIYAILGWLKSSVFIWFLLKKYNSTNLYLPDIMKTVIIPELECLEPGNSIEKHVIEIINYEKNFLKNLDQKDLCKLCEKCDEHNCIYEEKINLHNNEIVTMAKKIDEEFFKAFDINKCQQLYISNDLRGEGIFDIISK